jgi:hypothetical protein
MATECNEFYTSDQPSFKCGILIQGITEKGYGSPIAVMGAFSENEPPAKPQRPLA